MGLVIHMTSEATSMTSASTRRHVLGGLSVLAAASAGAPAAAAPSILTKDAVMAVLLTWFHGTNEHVPVEQLETLLAPDVEMHYPNQSGVIVGLPGFRQWYAGVLAQFFDETHVVETADIAIDGDHAVADLTVRWETRSWKVGAARSEYHAYLSHQKIRVGRLGDARVVITSKNVSPLEPTAPLYGVGS
jgi:hypothetical protein